MKFRKRRAVNNPASLVGPASAEHRFALGYNAGYARGCAEGYSDFGRDFEGTSIIIPTYNKKGLLEMCLNSIEAHTPHPYEIIVVDDASSDGTAELLQSRSKVRLAKHTKNSGFAGSVNTGLMMAKGRTVVVLNNDVLVTENWLGNMLNCLNSSPDIGAVGPVTNYIGGEQQLDVPYVQIDGMQGFAAEFNQRDPGRWRQTERLVGFCLLMRKETVLHTGFFDEGYSLGNYEDDDWMIRLRIQGLKLMIAGDTFVHHFGSETMKSLDPREVEQNTTANQHYFHQKWGGGERFLRLEQASHRGSRPDSCSIDLLGIPMQVLVCSSSGTLYWLEKGRRYRIQAADGQMEGLPVGPPVRLSQPALRGIPFGGELDSHMLRQAVFEAGDHSHNHDAPVAEGTVYLTEEGQLGQIDRGMIRCIWSRYTAEAWGLLDRARPVSARELEHYAQGSYILPPIHLHSQVL